MQKQIQLRSQPRLNMMHIVLLVAAIMAIAGGIVDVFVVRHTPAVSIPNTGSGTDTLPAPRLPAGSGVPSALNMGMPAGASTIPITSLQAPATSAQIKQFTLTAQDATLSFGSGITIPSWTFNGVEPGPILRVRQGDLVVVNVVNHLSFGITVHWHGINVPNSADGVAGVTQDAIKPGQTYVYRFVATDPGTYWYHSHQLADEETTGGLFGMLIVDPKTPTIHADVDYSVALHEWNASNDRTVFTLNNTARSLSEIARPGQWVRLRIAETSNVASSAPHLVTLLGAPFKVVSLDGHDLNAPQWLRETPLPIGTAQRYDLLFQMPAQGAVSLVTADEKDNLHYQRYPAIVIGRGSVPAQLPAVPSWFDMTAYGQPARSAITAQSHFDASYSIALNNQMGSSMGRSGMTYTMNGKVFPNTDMIMVKEGQLVKIHFDNQSAFYHPMHLHGHTFTVIAHNGQPLTGSPILLDTVLVPPHSSYDIAFAANNPGIWMIHCHNFVHANWGMDMMLMYDNYSTPYNVGTQSGNFPD